ncbi:MAG: drug/metabolite transporter (DMT)-like permease [Paracoccaceae bacterium]|jgi:drug/metabolite transporter (DMT)-like permease
MIDKSGDRVGLAIALSLLSLVLFDLMGLIIKHLSPVYTAAELSAYRNLIGLIPSIIALWSARAWHAGGRKVRVRQWPLAISRGMFITLAQFLFYYSLGQMAFATTTTITYANALFMTALAIPILGERVGAMRWFAVLLGFGGVLMVVKPGSASFSIDALAPLGAAFLYALAGVTARRMDRDVPSPLINLYSSATALVGAFALAMWMGGFSDLRATTDLLWIACMGLFGGSAVLCMVISFRMTDQSNLAPFNYFGIPLAFVFGWLFFDETPFGDLFPGAILIAAGGLLVIWRERRLKSR